MKDAIIRAFLTRYKMCGYRAITLAIIAGFLVCSGLCQNAEYGKRFHDLRNAPIAMDLDSQRDEFWDAPPEGSARTSSRLEEAAPATRKEEEASRGEAGNEDERLSLTSRGKSLGEVHRQSNTSARQEPRTELSHTSHQGHGEHRRKKCRCDKQWWRDRLTAEERENLVNGGGRRGSRGRKKSSELTSSSSTSSSSSARKSRGRAAKLWAETRGNLAIKFWEERRRRRRNRKRTRNRLAQTSSGNLDDSLVGLLRMLSERKNDEAKFLNENPLNLSMSRTTLKDDDGSARLHEPSNATSSSSQPRQLTTRIPESPLPTSDYHVEREFSRHMEREFSQAQLENAEENENEQEEEEEEERETNEEDGEDAEDEESPKFDERYSQPTKQPEDLVKASSFDPGRMLGYSRTDEDLPILDMENEVLQRTLKDYNAYMSSSAAKNGKISMSKNEVESGHRQITSPSSITTEVNVFLTDDEDDLQGDLSCINGTFLPAPFVRHAVIKYVKSSRPGHEYLEADYECEPGYAMSNNGSTAGSNRALCKNRRWIGRLPVCKYRGDDEATCTELGCEQFCKILDGKARCQCKEGYRLEGHRCFDIDECLSNEGRGPCEDTCRNLPGGYACTCEGRFGTTLAPNNHTCQETASPCNYNNAGCSHTCLASMGRVFCLCPDGFMLEDDWKTCQDVDECAVPDLQTEVCRFGCINTPGSYRCAPEPASQNPLELLRQMILRHNGDCQPGYEPTGNKNCVDINECAINNGGCSEVCENTEGSYFCACEGDERILSSDRKTCVVAEKRFESMDREAALGLRFRETSEISCSPLNPAGRGYLICADDQQSSPTATTAENTRRKSDDEDERKSIRPGTKCHLKCPHGYELHGEYELTCRADGTWDGPKHGECLRYGKPRLDCPKDVVAELPPGRDEAFVTYEQPSTDLDWFRYVRSKPSWGTRLEANLKQGVHEIVFYARHPVSKKQTSCTLKITVEEGQAPKVKGCPSDIEVTGKNGSAITWIEPVFTDNVKVLRVTSNESPGRTFSTGGHKIEYEASDEAGWTTKCIFTVVLRPIQSALN